MGERPTQCPPPLPHGIGTKGRDTTVDSDEEEYICTSRSEHSVEVLFTNMTKEKVKLYWINERGKYEKLINVKPGETEAVSTYESHPFFAVTKNGSDVLINGNFTFLTECTGDDSSITAYITHAPPKIDKNISSRECGAPVTLKFSNRTQKKLMIKWVDADGFARLIKKLCTNEAWLHNACDGHFFKAMEIGGKMTKMDLNGGWFYQAKLGSNHQSIKTVLITERVDRSHCHASSDSD